MKTVYVNVAEKPYTEGRLTKEAREFMAGLLGETQEKFRKAFLQLAKSEERKDQRKFLALYLNLAELVVNKPVASVQLNEEEFLRLISEYEKNEEGGQL